ncbi:hypothetical protein [Mycolicibacterium thermoresistibile]
MVSDVEAVDVLFDGEPALAGPLDVAFADEPFADELADESCDDEPESVLSAQATPVPPVAMAAPTPSATANAPTRPT